VARSDSALPPCEDAGVCGSGACCSNSSVGGRDDFTCRRCEFDCRGQEPGSRTRRKGYRSAWRKSVRQRVGSGELLRVEDAWCLWVRRVWVTLIRVFGVLNWASACSRSISSSRFSAWRAWDEVEARGRRVFASGPRSVGNALRIPRRGTPSGKEDVAPTPRVGLSWRVTPPQEKAGRGLPVPVMDWLSFSCFS